MKPSPPSHRALRAVSETDPAFVLRPGQRLGRYELLLEAATSAATSVWCARRQGGYGFQKLVALKVLRPELRRRPRLEQLFLHEASLAAQVLHPNTVEIFDLDEQGDLLFVAMEWLDGTSLSQLMRAAKPNGGVPRRVAVRLLQQACAGVHAAHAQAQLAEPRGAHDRRRQLSPDEFVVTYSGLVKLVGFGVDAAAAAEEAGDRVSQTGERRAHLSYWAPEQVLGGPVDQRADVFALGTLLYALTTGAPPFCHESSLKTLLAITAESPALAPTAFDATYPAELEAVLLRALAKQPDERYARPAELQRALAGVLPPGQYRADNEIQAFVETLLSRECARGRRALSEALEQAARRARPPSSATASRP